jgi:serine phosphatase RsbU (regulator of sigma subunit)
MKLKGNKSDVLAEASLMLAEPGRNTKRRILSAINAVFIFGILLHLILQLINTGTLPDVARDMLIYPVILLVNAGSLIYNLRGLSGKIVPSRRKDKLSAWSTLILGMLLATVIVHANENLAMSLIFDFSLSVILLFVIGTILGRKSAIIWFILCLISLWIAYSRVGFGFEYHLLSPQEYELFNQALELGDPQAKERLSAMERQKLTPFPSVIYVSIWVIFLTVTFLTIYFESNMISRILRVIPNVIEKISIASEEKNKLENENLRMATELDVAQKIQTMMLPKVEEFKASPNLQIAARMEPATEVGGDFYEYLCQRDGSVILAIGDVTDHGLQSGLVMLMVQAAIRTILDGLNTSLSDAINQVNAILYRNIRNRLKDSRNLTLSLIRVKDNHIAVCGQHENILYYNSQTEKCLIISTNDLGMYVGLIEDISDFVREEKFVFNEGDVFMFYTDGLTEAENELGELYGEDRMIRVFSEFAKNRPVELLKQVYEDVHNFIGDKEIYDDITVLIIKKGNN